MLFNSYEFILLFLPITFFGFYWIATFNRTVAAGWLAVASLAFYGWWDPRFVALLLGSVVFNYAMGKAIDRARARTRQAQRLLLLAVVANLSLLGTFKYLNFAIRSFGYISGEPVPMLEIVLPLGISFFTFTQIAYLVDVYQGIAKEYRFVRYTLFVTWFPHLIAGPVLHHKEMMPQLEYAETYKVNYENVAVGLTVFALGLFKKVVLADGVAAYANPLFSGVSASPTFLEAWAGVLAYTLQLYFDFSGYSDMAVGLSKMFGVRLPINFYSPYKAQSIIEFWRRWHMSLSRFLRDYLYIPLGGNRSGPRRRYVNLMITMVLGGLWHGAGWTFVFWGALHGLGLMINHGWRHLVSFWPNGERVFFSGRVWAASSWLLTFVFVVFAWAFFRATDLPSAVAIVKGMLGINGFVFPETWLRHLGAVGGWLTSHGFIFGNVGTFQFGALPWIAGLLALALIAPNVVELTQTYHPALEHGVVQVRAIAPWIRWRAGRRWAVAVGLVAAVSIGSLTRVSEFLYFQF